MGHKSDPNKADTRNSKICGGLQSFASKTVPSQMVPPPTVPLQIVPSLTALQQAEAHALHRKLYEESELIVEKIFKEYKNLFEEIAGDKFDDSISKIKVKFYGRHRELDLFYKLVDALLYSSCTEFTNSPEDTNKSMKKVLHESYYTFISKRKKHFEIPMDVRNELNDLKMFMVDKIISHTNAKRILPTRQHLKRAVNLRAKLSNAEYVIREEELRAWQARPKEKYFLVPKGVGDFLRRAEYFIKPPYENNETQTVNKLIVEYGSDLDQLCTKITPVADRPKQCIIYLLGHGTKQGSVGEKYYSSTGPRIQCNDFLFAINNYFSMVNLGFRPRVVLTQCHAHMLDSKSFSNIEIHSLSSAVAPRTLMCGKYHFSLMLYEIESNLQFFEAGPR